MCVCVLCVHGERSGKIVCHFLPSSPLSYSTHVLHSLTHTHTHTHTHPKTDKITANGIELKTTPKKASEYVWYKMNKPKGTLTAIDDRSGRKSLSDWVPEVKEKGLCVCVCVCWYVWKK